MAQFSFLKGEDQGRQSSPARPSSSSALMHAHMAIIPACGRRGFVLLGSGTHSAHMTPMPALQVVVMDALAIEPAAETARTVDVFKADMPRAVPLQRWMPRLPG
ncbi:hypothetical protein COCOBI_19-0140 [Coccomyxa sp. Obi]|nr:hypothetical protein COCOBI_19-0140 [Coccomyxa sp. Obi]